MGLCGKHGDINSVGDEEDFEKEELKNIENVRLMDATEEKTSVARTLGHIPSIDGNLPTGSRLSFENGSLKTKRLADTDLILDDEPVLAKGMQPPIMDMTTDDDSSSSADNVDIVDEDDEEVKKEELSGFAPMIAPFEDDTNIKVPARNNLYAFIIENKNYKRLEDIRTNNKVDDICRALTNWGFEVTHKTNLKSDEMKSSYHDYCSSLGEKLKERSSVTSLLVLYILGHSHFEVDEEDVFFLPVNSQNNESTLTLKGIIDHSNKIHESVRLVVIMDGKKNKKSNPLSAVDGENVVITYPLFWKSGLVAEVLESQIQNSNSLNLKILLSRFKEKDFYVFSNITKNIVFKK